MRTRRKPWKLNGAQDLKTVLPRYDNFELKDRIDREIHDATDRRILKEKLIHNKTLLRISNEMDIPLSTVRDHYYRQRKILFPEITRK